MVAARKVTTQAMAFEFADMLKETLDKMSSRIEEPARNRDASKPLLIDRLKAYDLDPA